LLSVVFFYPFRFLSTRDEFEEEAYLNSGVDDGMQMVDVRRDIFWGTYAERKSFDDDLRFEKVCLLLEDIQHVRCSSLISKKDVE
jgi:hypothetical protein